MTTLADANTAPTGIAINPSLGRQSAATTRSVNLSNEDYAALQQLATLLSGTLTVTANVGSGTQPVSGTVTANAGTGTMAVSLASLPALATGANVIGGVTQSGTWNVGTVTTVSTVTNLSQFGGAAINLGAGAIGTGTLRVTQASDSPLVAAVGTTADAAWTTGNGTQIALLKAIAGAAVDTATASPVRDANAGEYEFVAASATTQAIGATGAAGDWFSHIVIIPATTSPGAVAIKDGSGTAMTIFAGGASSVTSLAPITVALDLKSVSGAWQVTTGTNVSAIAAGNFT